MARANLSRVGGYMGVGPRIQVLVGVEPKLVFLAQAEVEDREEGTGCGVGNVGGLARVNAARVAPVDDRKREDLDPVGGKPASFGGRQEQVFIVDRRRRPGDDGRVVEGTDPSMEKLKTYGPGSGRR